MADASAAPNEAPQPSEASTGAEPSSGQPVALEGSVSAASTAPVAAEAPEPPTGEPQHLEAAEAAASTFSAPAPEPSRLAPAPQPATPAAFEAPASPLTATAPSEPSVASTIEVPPLEPGEGGEWELLVTKVRQWLASGQLRELLDAARTPLTLFAYLVVAVLVLQIYAALLDVLEDIPLVPGLLELVGVITVVRFALTRLMRSSDRQQVIAGLKSRWNAFRGQG